MKKKHSVGGKCVTTSKVEATICECVYGWIQVLFHSAQKIYIFILVHCVFMFMLEVRTLLIQMSVLWGVET